MIKNTFTVLFLFLFPAMILFGQEKEIFIVAGSLYDSENNVILKDKGIHVKGNKILSIGRKDSVPNKATLIDLSESLVLPGLIDGHTHVLFDQEPKDDFAAHSITTLVMESEALRTLRGAKRARSYLDVGITSIKDLGNSGAYLDVALRDAINEGSVEGPRIFAAGQIMAATGGQIYGVSHKHQELIDLEYRIIKSPEDAVNAVREHVNQNVDVIKICADNLPNNTRLSVEEMKSITKTAHDHGLTVTAHAIGNQAAWDAVEAGVDGIEHGFFLADSTLNMMAQKNVFLVPTENSRKYMDTYYSLVDPSAESPAWIDTYLANMKKRLTAAINAGVTIVAGSDNYTDIRVPRGISSRDMFEAYAEAGMKPLNILQSATFNAAKSISKENEIGILKSGAFADIIAIKGDIESEFLATIENVVFVMKNGEIYLEETE